MHCPQLFSSLPSLPSELAHCLECLLWPRLRSELSPHGSLTEIIDARRADLNPKIKRKSCGRIIQSAASIVRRHCVELRYPHSTRSKGAFVIRNRIIWRVAIGLWLTGCALHCYLYVVTVISSCRRSRLRDKLAVPIADVVRQLGQRRRCQGVDGRGRGKRHSNRRRRKAP